MSFHRRHRQRTTERHTHVVRQSLEHAKEIFQRRVLCRLRQFLCRREANDACVNAQPIRQPDGPHDDFRRAEDLTDADYRRARERRGHRQVEPVERARAVAALERARPERAQVLRQQDGRRLTQPIRRAAGDGAGRRPGPLPRQTAARARVNQARPPERRRKPPEAARPWPCQSRAAEARRTSKRRCAGGP